eukprot:TRINITY_DN2690_c0_g1_i1.p1 TRINITY_DN2690_c0_g1~~TRINITY_DN2690_c0_g1_i1.p1  ORF type:complete len:150 (-),score=27.24 TRINITY_DN2690_c0_g1_i1:203-652(-)
MVPPVLTGAAAYYGARINASNLEKAEKEQFATRKVDALETLPLNLPQKRQFALIVSDAFGEELVYGRLRDVVMKLVEDKYVIAVVKSQAEEYIQSKIQDVESSVKKEMESLNEEAQKTKASIEGRLTTIEGSLTRIEAQLEIVVEVLRK